MKMSNLLWNHTLSFALSILENWYGYVMRRIAVEWMKLINLIDNWYLSLQPLKSNNRFQEEQVNETPSPAHPVYFVNYMRHFCLYEKEFATPRVRYLHSKYLTYAYKGNNLQYWKSWFNETVVNAIKNKCYGDLWGYFSFFYIFCSVRYLNIPIVYV